MEWWILIAQCDCSINWINNRLVFRIKYGHKLELQTPETMKLYGSTKRINGQSKEWRRLTKSWSSSGSSSPM